METNNMKKNYLHVFIVGSKGIPARYGGYETFVDNLTKDKVDKDIIYHVSCLAKDNKMFMYNNAECFNVKVPNIGHSKAILYDIFSIQQCIDYIKQHKIEHPIIYILACRIGPFYKPLVNRIHRLGGKVFLNPDGHEWMRTKWSKPVRKYWKLSELKMVKYSDLIVCDSKNIEQYIITTYSKFNPKTVFIAYGSDVTLSPLADDDSTFLLWLKTNGLSAHDYFLSVGRFVPENNFETMISEFMASNTKKTFAIMTTENKRFYRKLEKKLHFDKDKRIKFVGTVYDSDLLKKIREQSFAYIHGHSVGGTNPSLLEALGSTKINLLFDVGFNREVAEDSALYWTKEEGNLSQLIDKVESFTNEEISCYCSKAKNRVIQEYSWSHIVNLYEKTFKNE
jgi:rhamnosyltransferase